MFNEDGAVLMRKSWSDIKTDRGLLCDIVNLKIGLLRIGAGRGEGELMRSLLIRYTVCVLTKKSKAREMAAAVCL